MMFNASVFATNFQISLKQKKPILHYLLCFLGFFISDVKIIQDIDVDIFMSGKYKNYLYSAYFHIRLCPPYDMH